MNSSASVIKLSAANWSCSTTALSPFGNGVPDHAVSAFPNASNPNTISAQAVAASFTLTPTATSTATKLGGPLCATGYILNDVKMDADTNGTCNDAGSNCDLGAEGTGSWRVEALGPSSFSFGTDSNNAHVQPDSVYHCHGMPAGLVTEQNKGQALTLIGWAGDGFLI